MKSTLIIISILLLGGVVHGQCTFNDFFPVEHGMSKFKTITAIASIGNIKQDKFANQIFSDYWDKKDYLNGDSVYTSSIYYNYTFHPCFKGSENNLYLRFVDDKLYRIEITMTFLNTEFDKCIENYNSLVTILKKQFPYWDEYVSKNEQTQEQIGEGLWMYTVSDDERDNVKIEKLSIGYEVEYGLRRSDFKRTGNVESYKIEISYVNLNGTKLTNKGF